MSTPPRPFRFGAILSHRGDARAWADSAIELEALGYSTLLVPDTLWTPSPFLVLTAAAASTSTLRLGTWVLSAPLRRPAEVVRETTTIQELSGGRFELGIGAGRPGGDVDAATLGAEWGSPRHRVDRVHEVVTAAHAQIKPAPDIVIAGQGERMLRIAGAAASTLALPVSPDTDLDQLAALTDRVMTIAGDGLELSLSVTGIGDDIPDWLRQQLGLTHEGLRRSGAVALLSGDVERDADTLTRIRDRTGISYLTVSAAFAIRLAPLVARLAGR
ncbi:LLM class flavin-dependent oxidoreductase [Glaciibacter flavus]|uniref:LLM class flavin-dependent oxidoreductase n=1 Tax=Orlajensenia flava TaxID=2565934 RepID=UPI003B00D717